MSAFSLSAIAATAEKIFFALKGLHGLRDSDVELLRRAEAGLRLIQSTQTYSTLERRLFEIALAELNPDDAFVVEAAASCAADLPSAIEPAAWRRVGFAEERRAFWLSAILRLSDALCVIESGGADGVYAAWTDAVLYIEFDGALVGEASVARAQSRVAALAMIAEREVVLAASSARRGAA